jgi:ubiquitin-like-conjugating enzyme ATG3
MCAAPAGTMLQVLEDVSAEHARKTITIEPHPHGAGAVQAASIHPCRHANVMHKLSEVVAGEGAEFRIEQ